MPTRRIPSLVLFLALASSSVFVVAQQQQQKLLWSEEFDVPGAPDPNTWGYDVGNWGWGNNEYQNYTDSRRNSFVDDQGNLHIVARNDDVGGTGFSSARLKTDERVYFQYGTITARIRIPNVVAGLWPGFWTLGQNFRTVDWPASGEIDIMEVGDGHSLNFGEGNRRVISAVHMQKADGTYYYNYTWSVARPVDLNLDYHLYKLEWTPQSIRMFVDDYQTHFFDIDKNTCVSCEELHQPHYLIFNVAVGGNYNIRPGDDLLGTSRITAPFPATMLIDYIRVTDNGHAKVFPVTASSPTTSQPAAAPQKISTTPRDTLPPVATPEPTATVAATQSPTESPSTVTPTDAPTSTPTTNAPTNPPSTMEPSSVAPTVSMEPTSVAPTATMEPTTRKPTTRKPTTQKPTTVPPTTPAPNAAPVPVSVAAPTKRPQWITTTTTEEPTRTPFLFLGNPATVSSNDQEETEQESSSATTRTISGFCFGWNNHSNTLMTLLTTTMAIGGSLLLVVLFS